MTANTPTITTLQQLLDYDARSFTSAEIQLAHHLPGWISKSGSLKLKTVLQKYLDFVQEHVKKLEAFFSEEQIDSLNVSNRVMKAMIDEAEDKMSHCADVEVKDACLLACIQSINHFKISTYGTAAAFAKTVELESFSGLFHEIEVREKQIDDRLTQLAEHEINISAKAPIALPS